MNMFSTQNCLQRLRVLALISVLFLLFMVWGCKQSQQDNEQYFEHVFAHIDNAADSVAFNGAAMYYDSIRLHQGRVQLIDSYHYYYLYYNHYLRNLSDPDRAMAYADSMLLVIERNDAVEELNIKYIEALYLKGDLLFSTGDYQAAYDLYNEGFTKVNRKKNPCATGDFQYRVAMVLYRQGDYSRAAGYFKHCYASLDECKQIFTYAYRQQEVLNDLGLCYYHLRNDDSASYFYQRALVTIAAIPESDDSARNIPADKAIAQAVVIGNIASVALRQGNRQEAESLLQESIQINTYYGVELRDVQGSLLKLASLYHDDHNLLRMKYALDKVHSLLDSVPNATAYKDWLRLMSLYYEQSNPAQAYQYLRQYHEMNDSLQQALRELSALNLTSQIAELEHKFGIAAIEQSRRAEHNYLVLALVIVIIGMGIVVYVVYTLRRTRKYMNMLQSLNHRTVMQRRTLEASTIKLEKAGREKDRILRVVAHDLRSPIAAIQALAELLLYDSQLTNDQREQLTLIKDASSQSLTLTKEILNVTAATQPAEMNMVRLHVNPIIAQQVRLLQFRAREKMQTIHLLVKAEGLFILADAEKLGRVICNLITNAIKFSKEGSAIEVHVSKKAGQMVLAVKDQGIGIPEAAKDKVFDLFTEVKRYGTAGEKPFGMGLAISRQIVQACNGSIWFESNEFGGTTFFVSFPDAPEMAEWSEPRHSSIPLFNGND